MFSDFRSAANSRAFAVVLAPKRRHVSCINGANPTEVLALRKLGVDCPLWLFFTARLGTFGKIRAASVEHYVIVSLSLCHPYHDTLVVLSQLLLECGKIIVSSQVPPQGVFLFRSIFPADVWHLAHLRSERGPTNHAEP